MKKIRKGVAFLIVLAVAVWTVFFYLAPKALAPEATTTFHQAETTVTEPTQVTVPVKAVETTFTFAGDMMFDRYINHTFKNIGFDHIFDKLDKTLFSNSDIRFANLEGPVSDTPIDDDYPARTLSFDMPPATISALQSISLSGVSLANNHTLNAGAGGFATTQQLLNSAGIKHAGSEDGFDASNIVEYDTAIPVAIICVDYLSFSDNTKITAAIQAEKAKGEFVIIFPHWGTEYSLIHTTSQETAAKIWIDAGADLIIGSHPHVVEDIDVYKNKPVIYSLGNFVFDQTFSADTQQGLIVSGKITSSNLELTFHPIESIKLYSQLATDEVKNKTLTRILGSSNTIPLIQNRNVMSVGR